MAVELHPLGFFLPKGTRLLMLGSFPPPKQRWSMNFYYPNFQNDMWRILGLIFFNDKDFFVDSPHTFSEAKAKAFCQDKKIGIGDTAMSVNRLRGNASDEFLQVVEPIHLAEVLTQIPDCQALFVTGGKATEILLSQLPEIKSPKVGSFVPFELLSRSFRLYRMPSSSRAYPLPLTSKAEVYRRMFDELKML